MNFKPLKKISKRNLKTTLYTPSTKKGIAEIITNQDKNGGAENLVFCFEDAISIYDIPFGIQNLNCNFNHSENKYPNLFIRVRDVNNYRQLIEKLDKNVIDNIDGLVIPKFTASDIRLWEELLSDTHFYVMITLETEEYFNPLLVQELFSKLKLSLLKERVLVCRLGGNDLLRGLSMKRPAAFTSKGEPYYPTLYDTPLLQVINSVMLNARLHDFEVSAPVFEYFDELNLNGLIKEAQLDKLQGFVGKTVINPKQCKIVNEIFKVNPDDILLAQKIYDEVQKTDGKALGGVSNHNNSMVEPTTHYKWAKRLLKD